MQFASIDPLIRRLARGFNVSETDREDLIQEGYLTTLTLMKKEPERDWNSEESLRNLNVAVRQGMINVLKRRAIRVAKERWLESEEICFESPAHAEMTEKLAEKEALRELGRLMNDIEKRVLKEILQPSDEFAFFVRKVRKIKQSNRKIYGTVRIRDEFDNWDCLAAYLGISIGKLKHTLVSIKEKGGLYYDRCREEAGLFRSIFRAHDIAVSRSL